MSLKSLLITVVVIIVVVVGGVLLWNGGLVQKIVGTTPESVLPAGEAAPTQESAAEGQIDGQTAGQAAEPTTGGSVSKMTDEIYIEILAQSSVGSGDPSAYASRIKALYEKYSITERDITAYAEELNRDPQRAATIGQKYLQRAMELRNAGK